MIVLDWIFIIIIRKIEILINSNIINIIIININIKTLI